MKQRHEKQLTTAKLARANVGGFLDMTRNARLKEKRVDKMFDF